MRRLSRSVESYLANEGWSSKEFLTLRCFYCDCKPEEILDFILIEVDKQKQDDPQDYSHLDLFRVAM